MTKQNKSINLTNDEKIILDLEKNYFSKLQNIIFSDDFKKNLKAIELEIQKNYKFLAETWKLKNKIKVAAERLLRYHIYKNFINDIKDIYPSPISSDIGIILNDCILCIDCKTLDTKGNSADINYTSVEPNQTSFDNQNYSKIIAPHNLETRYKQLPVLSFIVKIIYTDDKKSFSISKSSNHGKKHSLVLTCIPNGELSRLFNYNLMRNFKTYKYYNVKDGEQYKPIEVDTSDSNIAEWVEKKCTSLGYKKEEIRQTRGLKTVFYDNINNCYWTYTSENNTKKIRAISRGDTMRYNNNDLKSRYDSSGESWDGYFAEDI